jgi:hydrogenase maturation protease
VSVDRSVVLIGIGNPFRGDDGVGPAVVATAAERLPPGVRAVELDGEAARLVEAWAGCDAAVVVDAVRSGGPPGRVLRLDLADGDPIPLEWRAAGSTHSTGLAEAVALARALDRMPGRLVVYGIEGHAFEEGTTLSPTVAAGADEAVARVVAEVGDLVRTEARA